MNDLSSKNALVTGGSRGIGRAVCVALAANGANVAINYATNEAEANTTLELCLEAAKTSNYNSKFMTIGGNVGDPSGCEQIYTQAKADLGDVDILVNNAGITRDNLIMRMSVDDFDAVLDVNLRSAFVFSKLVSRSMAKARFGRIINISSVVGLYGNAGQANYAASKAGIIGLTKSLSKELGSRFVTVNAIAPGFIETAMTEQLSDEMREKLISTTSIPRLGKPQDIAALVAFLASDDAAYITGQVIAVDGGIAM